MQSSFASVPTHHANNLTARHRHRYPLPRSGTSLLWSSICSKLTTKLITVRAEQQSDPPGKSHFPSVNVADSSPANRNGDDAKEDALQTDCQQPGNNPIFYPCRFLALRLFRLAADPALNLFSRAHAIPTVLLSGTRTRSINVAKTLPDDTTKRNDEMKGGRKRKTDKERKNILPGFLR